ncbi:cupin domain-containing protein [Halobium salinum]|uniref:Cupin domain-containing protein n=1 Tax=Halobium salinum TaxID=1364940 RepID=A0ABD5PGN1_9EURY|nr:cupin domain-containing protein [Halobium salinum]
MKRISVDDVETPASVSPASVLRPLSAALGAEGVAVNYFELAPGESFGYDYHRHLDQEEVFYVLAGTATFETESGTVDLGPGEAVRFAPGEFQLGWNRGERRVVALALGAPRGSTGIEYLRACPTCAGRTLQTPELVDGANAVVVRCTGCGSAVDRLAL